MTDNAAFKSIAAVIIITQGVVPMMMSGVSITLPPMGAELGASAVMLSLVHSVYMGTGAALVLTVGRLADATDKHVLFKFGLLTFCLLTLAIGFLPNIESVIAVRALQGISGSIMATAGIAILMEIVPPEQRGRYIGMSIGSNYVGLASGPVLSGLLTAQFGWRSVYIAVAIPSALGFLVVSRTLVGRWERPRQPINLRSSAVFFAAVMLLVFGSVMAGDGIVGYATLAAGAACGVAFALVERRSPIPLLDFRSIRANPVLFGALSTQMLLYCSAMSVSFLFSLYLQVVRGLSPHAVGVLMVCSPIAMAMVAPVAGYLSDHWPAQRIAGVGALMIAASLILALFTTHTTPIPQVLTVLIMQGVGFALFSSPNVSIIMRSVGPEYTGMAGALTSAMRTGGTVIGMLVVNGAMSLNLGDAQVTADPPAFLRVMLESLLVFSMFGMFAVLQAFRTRAVRGPL